jgi:hypothetical protein
LFTLSSHYQDSFGDGEFSFGDGEFSFGDGEFSFGDGEFSFGDGDLPPEQTKYYLPPKLSRSFAHTVKQRE